MAIVLEPGEVTVYLHRAESLKDADWFGKQDPYVILRCGEGQYRSNTHECGGRNPTWEQQFVFRVNQETTLELEVYDQDTFKPDDCLGKGKVDIVSVRQIKKMSVEVPLFRRLSHRQAGHVYLTLMFLPARSSSSGTRSATATATATATAAAANSGATCAAAVTTGGSGVTAAAMATYALHEQEAAVASQFAAAFLKEDGKYVETRGVVATGTVSAPSAHIPSPGSSLAPGLVSPGNMPDVVPSYEPTCGLIQPHPDKLLPCHASSSSTDNSNMAPPAPPLPSSYPGIPTAPHATAPPTPGVPSSQYHAVHSHVYGMGPGFDAPPASAAVVGHPGAAGAPLYTAPYQPSTHYATLPGSVYHVPSHPYTPAETAPPPMYGLPSATPPPGSYHWPNPPQPAYSMPLQPPSPAAAYPPSSYPVQHPLYGSMHTHGYAHPGYS